MRPRATVLLERSGVIVVRLNAPRLREPGSGRHRLVAVYCAAAVPVGRVSALLRQAADLMDDQIRAELQAREEAQP